MADGSDFPHHLRHASICENRIWDERKQDRVLGWIGPHDISDGFLYIWQRVFHCPLNLCVSVISDHNISLNLEVVLHGIAIGFSGLETLLGIIAIVLFLRINSSIH